MLTNLPLRNSACSPAPRALSARARKHRAEKLPEQRFAQQAAPLPDCIPGSRRGRPAPALRQASPSPGRTSAPPDVPGRRARRANRSAAARPGCAASRRHRRVVPTPNRTPGTPPEVQSGDFRSARDLWLPYRMKKATSVPYRYLPCLSTSYEYREALATLDASINCQALKRYLRSFSTSVVRRMRSKRAASATVPSASSSALRIRPISIADR